MSNEKLILAKSIFKSLDPDGEGVATVDSIAGVLASLELPPAEVQDLVREAGAGGDVISFEDFLKVMAVLPSSPSKRL